MEPLQPPPTDPSPIFELFRSAHATELMTAAVVEFDIFNRLERQPQTIEELRSALVLAERPAIVLITALRALELLKLVDGQLVPTELARNHLTADSRWDVSGYVGLAAQSPGVLEMIERLKTNRPIGACAATGEVADDEGTAFIFRQGTESAMEREASARRLTLSLAGRANNVAPVLAMRYSLDGCHRLLDVGGGSGLYAIAWLQRHPQLHAIVWDRPEVLKVAREMAELHGVSKRLECLPGDIFVDPVPDCDVHLVSNVLHDWDVPECRQLIGRLSKSLPCGGRLLIHDVLLNDDHDGPPAIALYSASLFTLTEGRAYSGREFRAWLGEAGLIDEPTIPTLIHAALIPGRKP